MRDRNSFLRGLFDGLASPANLTAMPDYPKLTGTDASRMRQDVRRVGNDFKIVIQQEHVKRRSSLK